MSTTANAIEVKHLSKQYKETTTLALNDVTFTVRKGEIYGILGPNGAGKTTLMSVLFGSIKPTMGSFTIAGLTYKDASLRYKIGVVPQEYALYPTLTARENLHYFGSLYGLKGKQLKKLTDEALERVALAEVADKKIAHFSGGMKRRINLVAGILHSPEVLFLDEPTVGVDVQSKLIIIDYLKELNKEGMSVLYTSHHLQEAQDFCDRVGILSEGQLLKEDTPKNLIKEVQAMDLEEAFIQVTSKG
ncbi:ABC transporter ATP-binding protein [Capnocytophaga sp. HP1101]